ncbi:MAG: hypothetical protein GW827_02720 [Flavobacteriales bacterium]|nr:hypothetical protein [Flavobacteriia bacterium]NCP05978.1 hypothetical protein [Flavobacteriales bacterium]PIV93994.1 MAG: hypothetical protein COW44_06570 [Flavobacteriaceae bacterium CG17_big_fil_post_rev_8_21_14_2_50_33_15]PIY10142.1 MAG: hypothetical protein COZ17_10825 [Flavobacteriaceae bacterium CG_4_10_14_3_um_filter_33_47]PJB16303.1 MAG: hypothetical protein CO117_15475 [Flavobacteriaceae bacterium CG_4_9_14_3_um_filter_33_16]
MIQTFVHYGCHVFIPLIVAFAFYRKMWVTAFFIMLSGLWIDVDHLLANPIFDPNRCSINFHPLHSYWAIGVYIVLLFPKKTRLIGLGLVIHILSDVSDCSFM